MRDSGSVFHPRRGSALAWLTALTLLLPGPARATNPDLSKPCTYTVGDAIAARMQGIFRIVAGLEASTLVYYDRDRKDVVAEVVGDTDDVEGAKRELDSFVRAIQEEVVDYARKQHHVTLTDRDVTVIYYNAGDDDIPVEVVRRVNGAYVVPKAEEGGNEDGD